MHVSEESHSGIVPMNHSNKDGRSSAESEEGRPLIKENAGQPNTYPTQSGKGVSQGLAGVRKAARENKEMKFTALLHHLTVDLLRESFYSLKRTSTTTRYRETSTNLGVFRDRVLALWWRTIRRRSQKRRISWTRISFWPSDAPSTACAPSLS